MSDHWIPGHDGRPRPAPGSPETMTPSQRDRVVTPDGVPLSGWWRRALAYGIDGFGITIVVQALLLPVQLIGPVTWFGSTPDRVLEQAWSEPLSDLWWFAVASIALTLVLGAVYSIVMLTRLGWTVGKRITGIRVRHRDHERLPTVAEASTRWLVQLAPAALGGAGWAGGIASAWTTIDGLRPLWNARRQAFHDSAAGTSVVRA